MEEKPKQGIEETIMIPEGVHVKLDGNAVVVSGPKGTCEREFRHPLVKISVEANAVKIVTDKNDKRRRKIVGTYHSHIYNMIEGSQEEFVYRLKICSGHFPMHVSVKGNEFVVANFYGEKIPRKLTINPGAKVEVKGDIVEVTSINKEIAGQTAASIERLTRRPYYDIRIFQDGIFIIEKSGKELK